MNKIYLIFKHEFFYTVKRKGFIIMTLIVPLSALLVIGIGRLASNISKPPSIEIKTMGYVDEVGRFDYQSDQGYLKLIRFNTSAEATQALINKDITEYFVITAEYMSTGVVYRYTLEKELITHPAKIAVIKNFLTHNLLAGKVSEDMTRLIISPLNLKITRLTNTGEVAPEQSGWGNIIIPGIFAFLLGFSLLFMSNYLIQGMGEEKESRLIEVLLSSVSIRQLLTGKVLGLGAAGFIQVLIWLISAPLILKLTPATFLSMIGEIQIPSNFIMFGIIYFIMGYLLFAVLSIGIGAISPNAQAGQQLALIYTLFGFAPVWFLSLLLFFPKSPIWTVLTLFPITAPVETMLRLGVSDIPPWEIVASIFILGISIIGGLFLSIKIFRVYLLMYGKTPRLGEIIKNLKNG